MEGREKGVTAATESVCLFAIVAVVLLTVSVFSLSFSFCFSSVHVTHLCADKLRLDYATLFAYSPSLAVFIAAAAAVVAVVIVFPDHCAGAAVAAVASMAHCFTTVCLSQFCVYCRTTLSFLVCALPVVVVESTSVGQQWQ